MVDVLTALLNVKAWPWPVTFGVVVGTSGYTLAQLAKLIEAWRKQH
jgi:hypothetical protein